MRVESRIDSTHEKELMSGEEVIAALRNSLVDKLTDSINKIKSRSELDEVAVRTVDAFASSLEDIFSNDDQAWIRVFKRLQMPDGEPAFGEIEKIILAKNLTDKINRLREGKERGQLNPQDEKDIQSYLEVLDELLDTNEESDESSDYKKSIAKDALAIEFIKNSKRAEAYKAKCIYVLNFSIDSRILPKVVYKGESFEKDYAEALQTPFWYEAFMENMTLDSVSKRGALASLPRRLDEFIEDFKRNEHLLIPVDSIVKAFIGIMVKNSFEDSLRTFGKQSTLSELKDLRSELGDNGNQLLIEAVESCMRENAI